MDLNSEIYMDICQKNNWKLKSAFFLFCFKQNENNNERGEA